MCVTRCLPPLLLLLLASAPDGTAGKSVRTTVEAGWAETSLLHEGAEYVWQAGGEEAFWGYVSGVAARVGAGANAVRSQQARHGLALRVAKDDVGLHEAVRGLMEYAMATRVHSPKLVSQYSLCGAIPAAKHPFVVTPEGDVITDPAVLATYLQTPTARAGGGSCDAADATCATGATSATVQQNLAWASSFIVDHTKGAASRRMVVCASLEDPQFPAFYTQLVDTAAHRVGAFQTVLRFSNATSAAAAGASDGDADATAAADLATADPVYLQGYGVSMMVKNMEYKAIDKEKEEGDADAAAAAADEAEDDADATGAPVAGLKFDKIRERYPEQLEAIADVERRLREEVEAQAHVADISLAVWEVQKLGIQSVYKVLKAPEASRMSALASLVQDFPKHASALSKINKPELKKIEAALKRMPMTDPALYPAEGFSTLYINGVQTSLADVSVYTLYEKLREGAKLTAGVEEALAYAATEGLTRNTARLAGAAAGIKELLVGDAAASASGAPPPLRYRIPLADVLWTSDVEKDPMFQMYPKDLNGMLQRGMYGMRGYARRNVFNSVSLIDPSDRKALMGLFLASQMMRQGIPVHAGLYFVAASRDADARAAATYLSCAFERLYDADPQQAQMLAVSLIRSETPTSTIGLDEAHAANPLHTAMTADAAYMTKCTANVERRTAAAAERNFMRPGDVSGLLFNGVFTRSPDKIGDLFYEESDLVANWVATKQLKNKEQDILEWILTHNNATDKYQPLFQTAPVFATAALDRPAAALAELEALTWFYPKGYSYSPPKYSYVMALDLSTDPGLRALSKVVKFLTTSAKAADARFAFVLNTEGAAGYGTRYAELPGDAQQLVRGVFATVAKVAGKSEAKRVVMLRDVLLAGGGDAAAASSTAAASTASLFRCKSGHFNCLTVNGRYFPLAEPLDVGDYEALTTVVGEYVQDVHAALAGTTWTDFYEGDPEESTALKALGEETSASWLSAKTFVLAGVLAREKARLGNNNAPAAVPHINSETCPHPCRVGFHIPARTDLPLSAGHALDIVASVDPLASEVQHLIAVLAAVHTAMPLRVSIYFNPRTSLTEVPLKTFYRYVAAPRLVFDEAGAIEPPTAVFGRLPEKQVLTMGMHEPEAWIVTTKHALHDLDNIKLDDVKTNTLSAGFQLDYITVTGSCVDRTTSQPPRGLPLQLTRAMSTDATDTLVMSNLGYFQLKAVPGVWTLSIQTGSKAAGVYEILGVNSQSGPEATVVFVNDFNGVQLGLEVQKRAGMEKVSILSDPADVEGDADAAEGAAVGDPASEDAGGDGGGGGGIFSKWFGSILGGDDGGEKAGEGDAAAPADGEGSRAVVPRPGKPTLNIFSLATGHLYERFLKIMLHTTMLYANQPGQRVKFWYLANFLSPQFKATIQRMAADWGCEVELVTYKWPQWLNRQKEKQRVIWGYKVLFLDVLFPLDVDKIIFVDADQIVRSDLHELYNLDLEGHAVAYTPFCIENENEETKGFRFWASGFWKDHLAGKPYHISAIYVVDLKRFRRIAAGDTYRSIYDSLSRDPGSLANLDQDLPNYLQGQVPIFSLPEHWLWCETWCNQASKAAAKTIDLCNNPLTKTPKLVNAKRIVPEWEGYDKLIDDWERKVAAEAVDA